MKKAAIPALVVIIFIAFGIILAVVALSWAYNKFIEFAQGKCWADMHETADQMKSDLATAKFTEDSASQQIKPIKMGDCAGGIIILNKNAVFDNDGNVLQGGAAAVYSDVIEERCLNHKSFNSFIIVIPWKTLSDQARKDQSFFSKWADRFTHPIMTFKDFWEWGREKMVGIEPICKGIDGEFEGYGYCIPSGLCYQNDLSRLQVEILNKETREFCYKPLKVQAGNSQGYIYRMEFYDSCSQVQPK